MRFFGYKNFVIFQKLPSFFLDNLKRVNPSKTEHRIFKKKTKQSKQKQQQQKKKPTVFSSIFKDECYNILLSDKKAPPPPPPKKKKKKKKYMLGMQKEKKIQTSIYFIQDYNQSTAQNLCIILNNEKYRLDIKVKHI